MKKKLAAVFMAAVLMLAMPVAAFADDYIYSPEQTALDTGDNGVTLYVAANGATFANNGRIVVASTSQHASNVPSGASVLASFSVTTEGTVNFSSLDFTFNVGTEYSGYSATVYIQHDSGAEEQQSAVVDANGNINITVTELSTFSVVIGDKVSDTSTATDTSSTSPKTGLDTTAVAGGVAVALVGAGIVAYAIRRKITE